MTLPWRGTLPPDIANWPEAEIEDTLESNRLLAATIRKRANRYSAVSLICSPLCLVANFTHHQTLSWILVLIQVSLFLLSVVIVWPALRLMDTNIKILDWQISQLHKRYDAMLEP